MKLTWLGHACFLLEADGYRIVTDPYTGVPGYPSLSVSSPFTVREIASFHDDRGGTLRGGNTIRVFTADGISVAHLGDLGHPLSAEQLAAIGPVDAALVPVGGVYTLDAAGAKAVCDALHPGGAVPMHYHHAPYGLPELAGAEEFLKLWPAAEVHRLSDADIAVTGGLSGVIVPKFSINPT